jgi:hypothetical protein
MKKNLLIKLDHKLVRKSRAEIEEKTVQSLYNNLEFILRNSNSHFEIKTSHINATLTI